MPGARVAVGAEPEGIVSAFGSIWVVLQKSGQLVRIDPARRAVTGRVRSGQPRSTVRVGEAPDPIAAGPTGEVLVALQRGPTLVTIDPTSAKVTGRRALGTVPALNDRANVDLIVTGRTAWVSSYFESRVYRIAV